MPANSHITKVFGILGAKVYKVTADTPPSTYTTGTGQALTGAKELAISGSVTSKELRGDNTLLDIDATLDGIRARLHHGKLNMDALGVMLGTGAVVDAGTTPNQTSTLSLLGGPGAVPAAQLNWFKVEAKSADQDIVAGDLHYVLYKCKLGSFPDLGFAEEDFKTYQFDVLVTPRLTDGKWVDLVENETTVALP